MQGWLTGAANFGVEVRTDGEGGSDYYSSEHPLEAERPRLEIDVSY